MDFTRGQGVYERFFKQKGLICPMMEVVVIKEDKVKCRWFDSKGGMHENEFELGDLISDDQIRLESEGESMFCDFDDL